jgi:hypothetical protein
MACVWLITTMNPCPCRAHGGLRLSSPMFPNGALGVSTIEEEPGRPRAARGMIDGWRIGLVLLG